jgi:hypothetical protein
MALGNANFDSISEVDLQALIDVGATEGLLLDFKRTAYGRSDADVKEFLKDTTSFANTAGGHLIIGMDENAGAASALAPLVGIDADAELQRLESLLRDGVEPRISGVRMRAVTIAARCLQGRRRRLRHRAVQRKIAALENVR